MPEILFDQTEYPLPWRVEVGDFSRIVAANGTRVATTHYPAGNWFAELVVHLVNHLPESTNT